MYKGLALKTGVLLAIMLFFNGMLTSITGAYSSNLIFHLVGFLFILAICIVRKEKGLHFKEIPMVFFLPGVLSVLTIVLNNMCIPKLGITLTIGISLFGQLLISNLIDHFGLFEMKVNKFKKEKLIGFSIILVGIFAMIWL